MYFLVQGKRAKLPRRNLVLFYATCIRSILVYVAPVFFYALPKYSQCERVQKKALSIICPSLSYDEALNEAGIPTIISYCEDICDKVLTLPSATRITNLTSKKKLTEANKAPYLLRNHRHFALPKWKTDCFKNTICYVGSKVMNHQTILYSWYYINNVVNIKRIFSLSTTIYLQP